MLADETCMSAVGGLRGNIYYSNWYGPVGTMGRGLPVITVTDNNNHGELPEGGGGHLLGRWSAERWSLGEAVVLPLVEKASKHISWQRGERMLPLKRTAAESSRESDMCLLFFLCFFSFVIRLPAKAAFARRDLLLTTASSRGAGRGINIHSIIAKK